MICHLINFFCRFWLVKVWVLGKRINRLWYFCGYGNKLQFLDKMFFKSIFPEHSRIHHKIGFSFGDTGFLPIVCIETDADNP